MTGLTGLHLQGDLDEPGVLEPAAMYPRLHDDEIPDAAVICFFPDTVRAVGEREGSAVAFSFTSIIGGQPCYVREVAGRRIAFFFPEIGAPRAVMFLEESIARGIDRREGIMARPEASRAAHRTTCGALVIPYPL